MANFTALKTAINNAIKTNGNEEITGNLLQEVLLAIVTTLGDGSINDLITALGSEATTRGNADTTLQQNINAEQSARQLGDSTLQSGINNERDLRIAADNAIQNAITAIGNHLNEGYLYVGIATTSTNPSTPLGKVFYIALAAGTYTNFLNSSSQPLVLTQGINILKYNGTSWSVEQVWGVDDEPTAGSDNLVKSGGVYEEVMQLGQTLATDGKPLPFNSYIYDHYTKNNGILQPQDRQRTIVYSVQSGMFLLLRWNESVTNINYGVFFSNDPTFATVESYLTPYTVTDGSKIIIVPDGVAYVAISNGYLTLLDGRQEGVVDNNINNEILSIRSNFNGYTPTLEFYGLKVGYLADYGAMAQTQSGSNFRVYLYSVTSGQVFYFKQQDIAAPNAYFGFCDDANISHIISYSKTDYGNMVRVVVPNGANYFIVNGGSQQTGYAPNNVYCLGEPKLNIGFVGTPVFNYFPAYSLNERNIVVGNLGGINPYVLEHIVVGNDFKEKGTLKYFTLDLSTQKSIFEVHNSLFRTQFKTTGKIRVTFDVFCEYSTAIDVRLYTWNASPQYLGKSLSIAANKIASFDYTFEVNSEQIANISRLELYIFNNTSTARIIKVANVIVTDDIFDGTPRPYFSRDWNIITRPVTDLYKTCIYIGDSISTANNYDWKQKIEDTYTVRYVRDSTGLNPANGGITIRPQQADESSLPNANKSIWYRCANARMGQFNFDIINLFGGQNDKGVVASNLLGTINDKPFVDDVNTFDNPSNYTDVWTDSLTFAQCYMGCIEMLKRDFPTKKLLLMSVYPTLNDADNIEQMAILQCQIAYKYNLEITPLFWDIFRISAVGAFTRDGVHPNTVLARQMAIRFSQTLGI